MMFLLISLVLLTLIYSYIGWRIIVPADLRPINKKGSWGILIVLMLSPLLAILLRIIGIETTSVDLLAWTGYLSLGFFLLVFTFLAIRDITKVFSKLICSTGNLLSSAKSHSTGLICDRRGFLGYSFNMGILGVSGSFTGYGVYEARKTPVVVEVEVPIKDLHRDLEGLRIVQLTDIHVGPTVKKDYVKNLVERTNRLSPDIIVITGDLVDGSVRHLRDDVSPLSELSARQGLFFVTGNHEYYSGADDWVKELERLGFTVLMNEHRIINDGDGSLLLAGVPDYRAGQYMSGHRSSPQAAIAGSPRCNCKILLAHQPRSVFAAAEAGFDLQISGHTHGGQFFPWNYFVYLAQPYVSGLNRHGDTWIYVSRGTGYWGPPLRIGSDSEITVLSLVRA